MATNKGILGIKCGFVEPYYNHRTLDLERQGCYTYVTRKEEVTSWLLTSFFN